MKNKTNSGFIQIIIIILAVLAVVAGAYYFGIKNKTVPVQITSPTPINSSNWESYVDSVYNFSFRHPLNMDFVVHTNLGAVGDFVITQEVQYDSYTTTKINGSSRYFIKFEIWNNPQNMSLNSWITKFIKTAPSLFPAKLSTITNYTVGGEKALRFWGVSSGNDTGKTPGKCEQSCPYLQVYFVHGDSAYLAELTFSGEVENNTDTLSTFDQILSTFKFTN